MHERIKAVIFDMDGTITAPVLDFTRIRSEIGAPPGRGLLESIAEMEATARPAAEAILHRYELAAANASTLNEGVAEALGAIASAGFKTAILTRNSRACVEIVLARHALRFDTVVAREDSRPKPDPDGVLAVARALAVEPQACVMVGDYEFDIKAGRAAGALTVLYSPDGRVYATEPDFAIRSMGELPPLLASLGR